MNGIRKACIGIARDDKPWIVLYFIWNPTILHFLPSIDIQSIEQETAIAAGWFFLNFLIVINRLN